MWGDRELGVCQHGGSKIWMGMSGGVVVVDRHYGGVGKHVMLLQFHRSERDKQRWSSEGVRQAQATSSTTVVVVGVGIGEKV